MKNLMTIMAAAVLAFTAAPAMAAPEVGAPAPDFTATDIDGNTFNLSDLQGKKVVLEWTNDQCPFVVKHYDSGNMQKTQAAAAEQGVHWITVNSSAPGHQGHVTPDEEKAILEKSGATPAAVVLDPSGDIGHLYDAKTTPHMFVINEEGTLVYAGAIDSDSSPRQSAIEGATNYVLAALDDLSAGGTVQTAQTQPYGCAVKYDLKSN